MPRLFLMKEEGFITGGNNYLFRVCSKLFFEMWRYICCRIEGTEASSKEIKKMVSTVGNRRMVTGQRVRESHVWKKIERYWKRERERERERERDK